MPKFFQYTEIISVVCNPQDLRCRNLMLVVDHTPAASIPTAYTHANTLNQPHMPTLLQPMVRTRTHSPVTQISAVWGPMFPNSNGSLANTLPYTHARTLTNPTYQVSYHLWSRLTLTLRYIRSSCLAACVSSILGRSNALLLVPND